MNPAAYSEMAETEANHWWFSGRRTIIAHLINNLRLESNSRILELGCGTGGNLDMLARYGEVSALEMDQTARDIATKKTGNRYHVVAGHCPDNIPFRGQKFDLICMLDVLEHINQDAETLIALKSLLRKNGRIIITVPAYQWLYGAHDIFLHHKRRYSAAGLQKKISLSGFRCIRLSYFNTLLFPLALIARLKDKLLKSSSATGTKVPGASINSLLKNVFAFERFALERFNLPMGVSLLCVLEPIDEP